MQGMLAVKTSVQMVVVIIVSGNFIQSNLSKGYNMKDLLNRMVEIQIAKDACKMKSQESDFEFLENKGEPVVINAMVEERVNTAEYLYDRINQIRENANEQI